jgi:two-component system, OmpR family, sensor kinase
VFASLRSRLLFLLTGVILLAVLATAAVLTIIAGDRLQFSELAQVVGVLGAVLALLWVIGMVLTYAATRPLYEMVRATRELSEGRHPDEALTDLPEGGEMSEIAGSFREMAMRLREVDSTDRRFLMSVSHELRTPLTAITGHAQALEDGLADDVEMRNRSLAVIRREAERLERLVEDIIDLAKLRTSRFNTVTEMVYLDELGEHLMAIFEDRPANADVEVRGDFEHIMFHSDGQRILQVLRNLVNNALRYADSEVVVTGERVRGRIRITVGNDGQPIPAEMHEKIFEPFVGTKREGGMGLGLAIGRELAWALGGNLRSLPAETGAVFELTLPLEPPGSGR